MSGDADDFVLAALVVAVAAEPGFGKRGKVVHILTIRSQFIGPSFAPYRHLAQLDQGSVLFPPARHTSELRIDRTIHRPRTRPICVPDEVGHGSILDLSVSKILTMNNNRAAEEGEHDSGNA